MKLLYFPISTPFFFPQAGQQVINLDYLFISEQLYDLTFKLNPNVWACIQQHFFKKITSHQYCMLCDASGSHYSIPNISSEDPNMVYK